MASAYSLQSSNVRKTWLLMFVFIGLVSALFFALSTALNRPMLGIIGLIISVGQAIIAYYFGGSMAIASAGGKEVKEQDNSQIHEMVGNLCRVADIPKPKIFISPDQSANAFACGRDPKHASICLNQGLLNLLNKDELEGVIAHELSHIKNRDILIMTVTMVLSGIIAFISDIAMRSIWFGSGRTNDDDNNSSSHFIFTIILYVVIIVVAPLVSALISMAVSRQREYLADASAVVMTRYPNGLISALEKLYGSPVPSEHYSTSTNHFYIAPPKMQFGKKMSNWFSTHPSIEDRVNALRKM
jgi:heat shock protein HtpX